MTSEPLPPGGFPQDARNTWLGQQPMSILPPMVAPSGLPAPVDARLLLFQNTAAIPFAQSSMLPSVGYFQNRILVPDVYPSAFAAHTQGAGSQATAPYSYQQPTVIAPIQQVHSEPSREEARASFHESATEKVPRSSSSGVGGPATVAGISASTASKDDSTEWASNEEVSDFLLASLGWESNHPEFTEEEFAGELESMTGGGRPNVSCF